MRWVKETNYSKSLKTYEWRPWFAWFPVKVRDNILEKKFVWLEVIYRKRFNSPALGWVCYSYKEKE